MTRLAWVDRAKGIAILLVVLHHVIQFSADQQWASHQVLYYNSMLQTFRMPLFFAMSGLFFSQAAGQSWRWLSTNRVLPFAYLYVVWAVIWNLCFSLTPVEGIGLGLRYFSAHFLDPGTGPWYILALTVYFIAAKVLSPLPAWAQLSVVAAVSVPVAVHLVKLPWAWEYICMYCLAFFAGMHGRRLLLRLAEKATWATVIVAATLWGIATFGVYVLAWPFGRYLFIPLCAVGIALGVSLAAVSTGAGVLSWFGRRTLPIYFLHQPMIAAVYSVGIIRTLPATPWVTAVILLTTLSLVVTASIAIWRVGRVVPGIFVAPWHGAGQVTMSRVISRTATGSR
ncbi:acyltransferase family protein [Mycobacterium deserti]|uniref:Acyltransferase family protein n=1 Tax=Mycobacterium deserti TaxID=2978347 RepID=A0ABT2MLT3_9MYCO|nr:acyltransferase family protein [Mycobacterium deserti]MCT7661921.1 acyltransferase family protein [Mycobacterium deserti]